MADDRDKATDGIAASDGAATGALPASVGEAAALVRPGDPGHAAYPLSEAEYWREAHAEEPYHDPSRSFVDWGPAYELGWVSYQLYGGEFAVAERVLANEWLVRKGVSALSWEEARPAARAAWRRAHDARTYVTDGSAGPERVQEVLETLFESARDGELGFREAAGRARAADLATLLETLARHCADWSQHWRGEIERRGGVPGEGGTVAGAAQRAWLQIRGLFGGASDAALLAECERGHDDIVSHCREALQASLPLELHEAAQRQLEQAQRHHDHIGHWRERAAGAVGADEPASLIQ